MIGYDPGKLMWSSFGLKDDESYASNSNLGPPRAAHQSCCARARKLHLHTPPPRLGRYLFFEHLQQWPEANTDEHKPQDPFPVSRYPRYLRASISYSISHQWQKPMHYAVPFRAVYVG